MVKYNLRELVDGTHVIFSHYQDGNLYYRVGKTDFTFPVPTSDCGSAKFHSEDKAMLFMRWIRKHLNTINEGNNG